MTRHKNGSQLIDNPPQQIYINLKEKEIELLREKMKKDGYRTPGKWVADLIRKELARG